MVEAIRNVFPRREQRAWWEPHLRRIEQVIAEELAYRKTTPSPDQEVLDAYQELADQLVIAAGQAYATALGVGFIRGGGPRRRGQCSRSL